MITRRVAVDPRDLPFMLIYLFDENGATARLACSSGLEEGDPAAPREIDLASPEATWPAADVLGRAGSMMV